MKLHLLRLSLFLAMNGAVLFALLTFAAPSRQQERALVAEGMAPNERLRLYLQDFCRKNWQVIPGYLPRFENAEFQDFQLRQALQLYHLMTDNYNATILDKDHRLRTAPGRRIIFVGGSGLAFGLDSELVAARYGCSPVNMGLSAGLGPRFMLQHAGSGVRRGDVVVICFEDSLYFGGPAAVQPDLELLIREVSPQIGRYFNADLGFAEPAEPEAESWAFPPLHDAAAWKEFTDKLALQKTARATRESAMSLYTRFLKSANSAVAVPEKSKEEPTAVAGESADPFMVEYAPIEDKLMERARELDATIERERIYVRSAFNEYGDRINHWGKGPQPGDRSKWAASQPTTYPANHPARPNVAGVAALINEFAAHCQQQGASVLVALPPRVDYPGAEEFLEEFPKQLSSLLEVPLICPFDQQSLPESCFFDTRAHLTWEGTKARMALLLDELDQHIAPATDLSIEQMIAARDRTIHRNLLLSARPAGAGSNPK